MKRNIIFLDVDGVLNTIDNNQLHTFHNNDNDNNEKIYKIIKKDEIGNTIEIFNNNLTFHKLHTGEGILNIDCIKRLKTIIDNIHNVKIVMSSYWRLSAWKMRTLKHHLQNYGINPKIIIDFTPRMYLSRTKEILAWKNHHFNINKWVAIDDMYLNLKSKNYVQTDPLTGLTDNDVNKIIKLFD